MTNDISLYRQQPLAETDFKKLMFQTEKYLSFKLRTLSKSVPKYDSDNVIYGWEYDLVPDGYEVISNADAPPQLIEAILRPSRSDHTKHHLYVLSRMKRYHGGDAGLYIIIAEIIRHIDGCSEFALMKICDDFALSRESPFFPDPAIIVHCVKILDQKLKQHDEPEKKQVIKKSFEHQRDLKTKIRIARMCKFVGRNNLTKWEKRFMEALGRK